MTSKTNKRNIEAVYSLSPMQQGMLFHSLRAPESGVYFEQLTCTLRGGLDVHAFGRAWQRVLERHPVLRTAFVWKQLDKTLQVVHRQLKLPLEQRDWRHLSPGEQEAHLEAFLQADRARGFDLSQAPLIRLALLRITEDAYYFVWSHHHILMDGWSSPLLLKEVLAFYEAFRGGQELHIELPRPYRDYIVWLQRQDLDGATIFWRQTLRGFTAPTPLVVDQPPESVAGREEQYDEQELWLSEATTVALQTLARQHRLTLSTFVQGAWALLLSRYSGQEDVVFGVTVSGRPAELAGVESMLGLFINTLPMRVHVPSQTPVIDWLKALQAQSVDMRHYEHTPLVQIQEWSEVPRRQPLFESILVFENYPVDASLQEYKGSLEIENIRSIEQTNYPLTVVSGPGRTLPLKISYAPRRFDAETIRRTLGHLGRLLEGIAANPRGSASDVPLLTEKEQQQLLVEWNATERPYPAQHCIHELFEAQVERTPDALAVVFEDRSLTYAELNRRANQLAHHLRNMGIGPEVIAGLCVERSLEMVVGLLGVLKAGGAFLPLDPDYPPERLAFMLQDAQVPVLLTHAHLLERLPSCATQADPGQDRRVLCLDADWATIATHSPDKPSSQATADNLAYAIYTSGSTGLPKGTLLQHRGLCNFVSAFTRDLEVGEDSHVLQFASFSFDASLAEIFAALLAGATVYLARRETVLSIPDLPQWLGEQAITVATLPPAILRLLPTDGLATLRTVMSVGEACSPDIVDRWAPGHRFLNGYGPTETTIGAAWGVIEGRLDRMTNVPIGRPLANTQVYILDRHLWPVPIGVPGELHIGGVGLARGYLNRPELTAERFIPHSFSHEAGARLYKTGDLARYQADGSIEFLGRVDHQVKLRGFRIELGEIEVVLSQHPAVRQAVVLAWEEQPGEKYLVAYVVLEGEAEPDISELRGYLKQRLPTYMLPSSYVILDALPLMPSGKVDRRGLPAPEGGRLDVETAYVSPRTPTEEIVAGIWEGVLGLEKVGAYDDFFELGGHSLLVTQVISRLRRVLNVELPLRSLFEAPILSQLAQQVEEVMWAGEVTHPLPGPPPLRRRESDEEPSLKIGRDGQLSLSFAQQRLWFLDQLAPGNLFYNIPMLVRLTGDLDIQALEQSLDEIVRRHEILRTTFATVDGQPTQVIAPELKLPLPVVDLADLPEAEREEGARRLAMQEARRPFDLARGPLLRARLFRLGKEDHIAVVTMHHIISDGWSMDVFVRELAVLYEAFKQGHPSPLPELPIQYADFAYWQREWLQGEVMECQLAYWKEQLSGRPLMLDLPTDRPRPALQSWQGATESFALPLDLLKKLRALSREEGTTLFMLLLAAFQTLLYRYTGQEDISVGTAIANRNWVEIERLIGFFVNTLVMRTDLSGSPSFREVLKRVREVALGAYAHQDLPFEALVEALQPERDLSHTPLFQVAFALQNTPAEGLDLPGLTLNPLEVDTGSAKFDLTLVMTEQADGLGGAIEYNTDLFDAGTIRCMAGHLRILLEGIVADPDRLISQLPLLAEVEQHKLLVSWNDTAIVTPVDKCAHELFERHVAQRPEAEALTFEGEVLTYSALNRRANQLAHYLQKLGVKPETLVGISTERVPEMVVGILGILKAGGAYLPLDPAYPPERLAFMLEDAQVSVLLTQSHLVERLPAHQAHIVCLDTDWKAIDREPGGKPETGAMSQNLAYVIYTSGSTGKPKGAMLRHQGLCNLTHAQRRAFRIREGSRILQFSPFSFDASVWETFMALANGATLCLAQQELLASGLDLVGLMRQERVTNVTLPPSVLRVLPLEELPRLETVIAAGEACTPELVARWAPGRDFFNAYGPTETTVCASMYRCDEENPEPPPIGRPIANTQLYILDPNMQLVPVGVPGELHVAGISLAQGYLNRPELTAAKFVPDPFSSEPGGRLYKTGDLVRYRPDGNIEFLGRIDHQVKVRGFRIELGEIEARLGQHPALRESVVVAREDVPGDRRLVAYVVSAKEDAPTVGELRNFLRQTLPEYMVPSVFVYLEALPLSPSGKVNRRALPAPEGLRPELEREYVAPRTPTEEKMAAICAELLGTDQIGIYDNFFELGGHSLLAAQFISRVRDAFHVELPLRSLFENPTVADLARQVEAAGEAAQKDSERIAQILEMVGQLSDDQVKAMLVGKENMVSEGVDYE